MNKAFNGFNHGTGKIVIPDRFNSFIEGLPIEIHLKEDGSFDNKPSFAIVIELPFSFALGQISLEMFNEGLKDIGYQITKIVES